METKKVLKFDKAAILRGAEELPMLPEVYTKYRVLVDMAAGEDDSEWLKMALVQFGTQCHEGETIVPFLLCLFETDFCDGGIMEHVITEVQAGWDDGMFCANCYRAGKVAHEYELYNIA